MVDTVRAPEIARPGFQWFNVPAPLPLKQLRGRLLILDFWTFCCINCMHLVPILRRIEDAFPTEVVVIGVHSPKFAAERDAANVAKAVARYGIVHPIIHDPDRVLWQAFAVRAWPTLVFVSPDGHVLGQVPGEPDPDKLLALVGDVVKSARDGGGLAPAALDLTAPEEAGGALRFPGKIKPVPGMAPHWAVADAGHHQIALFDDDGRVVTRYGSGEAGLVDGGEADCRFDGPQGLVATAEAIYVADTGNHAIRQIDLRTHHVTTLAGTGQRGPVLNGEQPAQEAALASPWDLEVGGARLFFANAGSHQLGALDLRSGVVRPLAGDGNEGLRDGPADSAQLAQPSGLALHPHGRTLYFVDSETSSVRALWLDEAPTAHTLVGKGLFEFGHVDGPFDEALLQHALGVAWFGNGLLVADSYNDALRILDLAAGTVRELDDGFVCEDPVCLPAGEPAGAVADGPDRVLMADTNNHRIVEYRLRARRYRTWAQ